MSDVEWEKVTAPLAPDDKHSDDDEPEWRYPPDARPPNMNVQPPVLPQAPPLPPAPPVRPPSMAPVPPGGSRAPADAPRRPAWLAMVAVVAALALAAGGFVIARYTESSGSAKPKAVATTTVPTASAPPVVNTNTDDEPIAAVASALLPSVVQIETRSGLGSGVIYDGDGHILTAAHVVSGAGNTVTVRFADGKTQSGSVLGADRATDIAVIKVDGDGLHAATLATGVKLRVGQTAVAVGSPFGLDQTVTAGIISAVDRAAPTLAGAIGMIQTDAPINPGNSGGPLADKQGRVIGINDQIESSTGANSGVGFAIPIDVAKSVADKIVAGEPVEFGFLGVSTDVSQSTNGGAVITSVEPDSAADKAGLTQGDEITAVDGVPVHDPVELGARIRSHKPGDVVQLTVVGSDGQEKTVEATLGSTRR